MKVTKAFFAVAGWGTRRLPLTKAIEKCMLPIGNRPLIDFGVQDAIAGGITDIYFIVGEESEQVKAYYRQNIGLEDYLKKEGKVEMLELIRPPAGVNFHYVTQPSYGRYGTTVPLALCQEFVEPHEKFMLIMGDQAFYRTDNGSNAADLIQLVAEAGAPSGLFCNEIPKEEVYKYGIVEVDRDGNYVRIVEKPTPEEAPSTLNNSSFYLFDYDIFEYASRDLARPRQPGQAEYYIIDAINEYVQDRHNVVVGVAQGDYMDCGSVEGWLHANEVVVGGAFKR